MITIIFNLFKKNYFFTILKKILKRFERKTFTEATKWAKSHVKYTTDEYLLSIDKNLFKETKLYMKELEKESLKKLSTLKFSLGGGGNYKLLYFFTRKLKPEIVIETGVAAGWTTLAILKAMKANNFGKLYSSDFPYFRIKNPEKYIGYLIDKKTYYSNWILDIRGDDIALNNFASIINDNSVKLFHYDSDKSYSGRTKAFKTIKNKLSNDAIIIFDDIQNNLHFRDLVRSLNVNFEIFEFKGKFVGVIGFQ